MVQTFRAVPSTTRSHADRHARSRRNELGQARLSHGVESSNVQNSRHRLLSCSNGRDLPLQSTLGGMPADAMVHLDDRCHRALSKAGYRAHGELTVRGGEQKLVGLVPVAVTVLEAQPKSKRAPCNRLREPRV